MFQSYRFADLDKPTELLLQQSNKMDSITKGIATQTSAQPLTSCPRCHYSLPSPATQIPSEPEPEQKPEASKTNPGPDTSTTETASTPQDPNQLPTSESDAKPKASSEWNMFIEKNTNIFQITPRGMEIREWKRPAAERIAAEAAAASKAKDVVPVQEVIDSEGEAPALKIKDVVLLQEVTGSEGGARAVVDISEDDAERAVAGVENEVYLRGMSGDVM